jgi:hypothetical protein
VSQKTLTLVSTLAASALASVFACYSGAPTQGSSPPPVDGPDAGAVLPFQADLPAVYVAKVKGILVGLPPTAAEVQTVTDDPSQLTTLIDGWMAMPEYQTKMRRFFELAFQQTQITAVDFVDQMFPRQISVNGATQPLIVQNTQESFARTVLELVAEKRPFTESVTTQRFMMTTAMMELYAFLDVWQVDDAGKVTDRFKASHPSLTTITASAAQGPIPLSQTLDPTSPNYMHWYNPDVMKQTVPGCAEDPVVFPVRADTLHYILFGSLDNHKSSTGATCPQIGGTALAPQLMPQDFTDWRMVTIRKPSGTEATSAFYDLGSLRNGKELVLGTPRVGFFSTPAFFANWQTNKSNEMRVTLNQALIVATGTQVDGTDPTVPKATPGLDKAHVTGGAECVGCHQTLDPLRSILAATYSWNYHDQTDPVYSAQKGLFVYRNAPQVDVANVYDFANALASHPLFAQAWVSKFCFYANSTSCDADDPEVQRIVGMFKSGYSWNTLVRTLLSSPLTTNTVQTKSEEAHGEVVAVSRRDHFCAALNARLGFTDVCGLDALSKKQLQTAIPEIVSGLPSDGYGRGSTEPVLPNAPSLFYRAATENICLLVSAQVIDGTATPGAKHWVSTDPDGAISDFVQIIMALTSSDPRSPQAKTLLRAHFDAAKTAGQSATDALKSTFVTACLSPSAVSIGL